MIFSETGLPGSFVVTLTPTGDSRGWFSRTYCKKEFAAIGHTKEWVQMNQSFTLKKGTVRGMHFQLNPHQEIKLVRCIAGSIYDVIVDLRKDSPTFLKWFGAELSAVNKKMMYVPEGFAHGFQTLEDNVELVYSHSEYYTPAAEAGIMYNDNLIDIKWPLPVAELSERDKRYLSLERSFKGI